MGIRRNEETEEQQKERECLIKETKNDKEIPKEYVRPEIERPMLDQVSHQETIQVLDLSRPRPVVLEAIRRACQRDGFFQVTNHGVPQRAMEEMLEVARHFFSLPEDQKESLRSEDPSKVVRLSSSFNINKEKVRNWREYLRFHCYPLTKYINSWPTSPSNFREVAARYCNELRLLVLRLLCLISESLGLEGEFLNKALGEHAQHMAVNYYSECPNPDLTFGLPRHTDPNALTVLMTDSVPGLQALRDGKWISVNSLPNSFVVNIGDQIEVLSNGIYKSGVHRAVVNAKEARISIPTFYCPSPGAVIEPAPELVDEHNHPRFRKFTYEEYYKAFWNHALDADTLHSFAI